MSETHRNFWNWLDHLLALHPLVSLFLIYLILLCSSVMGHQALHMLRGRKNHGIASVRDGNSSSKPAIWD